MVNANVLTVTNKNFDQIISSGVVVVDFWANWCGPCRMLSPIIDQLAEQFAGRITVGKVDVDRESELASRFRIMSVPSLLFFQDGKLVETSVGVKNLEELSSIVSPLLS
ncbi:thioredoxin [[Clostridium] leptum]|uniref:Thioredoxin n=1 Tax=Solibaculum mannosilyticum TaxID=2780922 RepID=A0A7I8D1Q3_9FIRM|nr:thioredoxin [Solibaculum mannosilyticum]MCO7137009.1 thioredoxin [[Clostridium] leptum]BCI60686.1 thioredoxin [Solibaculum mannosilyticum]CZT57713.1 Thioredoxin [Eubacteriaceae bacterium CHKCI005]